MNSLARFKWALMEARLVIKACDERRCRTALGPVAASLVLLDALHQCCANSLCCLGWSNVQREFVQQGSGTETLVFTVAF